MSAGVARQWCGALGKQANCQVAVSLHAACDAASVPISWRLFVPQEAADEDTVRAQALPLAAQEQSHVAAWPRVSP